MYGAGAEKLGSIIKKPKSHGEGLKTVFYENTPALAELIEDLQSWFIRNKYLVGLDGRKFFCRSKKDAFNTTLQGNSAILFKRWMMKCHGWIYENGYEDFIHKMTSYHDETQWHVDVIDDDEWLAHDLGEAACSLATSTGEDFNLNVRIDAACKVGFNWRHCH